MDLNKAQIIGRLTRDPEVKSTSGGQSVATFSVATSRTWKDQQSGEKKSQTEYHNVVAWRRLADIVGEYMKKGRQVYVEGYLQTRTWDDPSGNKKYRTEIVADNLIMLGGGGAAGGNEGGATYGAAPAMDVPSYGAASSTPAQTQSAPAPQPSPEEDTISVEDIPF